VVDRQGYGQAAVELGIFVWDETDTRKGRKRRETEEIPMKSKLWWRGLAFALVLNALFWSWYGIIKLILMILDRRYG